jgi:EAL domain-containing protein (putative c-di-GMP-specific phosphodiesterase class I)
MSDVARERAALETELQAAVANGEFELHYQPIVDVRRERPVGFEALLRWRHPVRGLLAPGAFIDVAEEAGIMVPLSRWTLEQACRAAASWPAPEGRAPLWVSVNLSPRQLKEPHLLDIVRDSLAASGLAEHRLMVEISEMTMLADQRGAAPVLAELRALGVRIALDDFGAGYSSLGHLRFLPLDVLKIDRCFVEQLGSGTEGARLADAVLRLGAQIHVESIVEGVERTDQLEALRHLGCKFAQGYLFSAAIPGADIPAMIIGDGRPLRAAS